MPKYNYMLLTTTEAAEQLATNREAIQRYFRSGILRGRREGKFILVEQRSVLALKKVIHQTKHGKIKTPWQRKQEALQAAAQATAGEATPGESGGATVAAAG